MSEKLGSIFIKNGLLAITDIHQKQEPFLYADQCWGRDFSTELSLTFESYDKVIYDSSTVKNFLNRASDIEINFHMPNEFKPVFLYDSWITSKDPRISKITKVIVNGPATIIIDHRGNKTVVKCQDEFKNYDPLFGFYLCLLRYILDKTKYHDVMVDIFDTEAFERKIFAVRTILDSHIGHKEMDKITYKFMKDNYLESPSKLFQKIGDAANKEMKKYYKKWRKQFMKNCEIKLRG